MKLDNDEQFIRAVGKGLASARKGDLLDHEEVGKRIERLLRMHPTPRNR